MEGSRPDAEAARAELAELTERALAAVESVVFGQRAAVRLMLTCLLARGHALIEGVPGTAKTLLARSMASLVDGRFARVQFTPDLMPSDITGTHVYDPQTRAFVLHEGPVFTDVLLADEINRTAPKTQAALLEVMEERAATLMGERRALSPSFTVFATQNPVEFEGTYPLPEAQLDRFMMKIRLDYPPAEAERAILRAYGGALSSHRAADAGIAPVFAPASLARALAAIATVHVDDAVLDYLQRVLAATRQEPSLLLGAGTRAGLHLLVAARTWAALDGRAFVTPDDLKELAPSVIAHRLIVQPDAQVDGVRADELLGDLLRRVDVPR